MHAVADATAHFCSANAGLLQTGPAASQHSCGMPLHAVADATWHTFVVQTRACYRQAQLYQNIAEAC